MPKDRSMYLTRYLSLLALLFILSINAQDFDMQDDHILDDNAQDDNTQDEESQGDDNAPDDNDKKIDIQDFGHFYPNVQIPRISSPASNSVSNPINEALSSPIISPVSSPIISPVNTPVSTPVSSTISTPVSTPISTPQVFTRPTSEKPSMLKGAIKIQNWVDDIPEFKVLFDGQETLSDENGFFTFHAQDPDLQKYKLIITRKVQHIVNKKNTFECLKLIPNKKYLCFSFKKLGHDQGIWVQKEKRLDKKNFVIPKNSIVFLIDPKYVEKIEDWNINLTGNFIKLPRIILKSKTEQDKLKRISVKSMLCLEDSVFHERVGHINSSPEATKQKVKVTLP